MRNTNWILGVATYCGPDSKFALNQSIPPSKFSSLDRQINRIVIALFFLMIVLCSICSILSSVWEVI